VGLGDREGWVPRRMYFGRGVWKGPPYVFLGGPLPKRGLHCVHPRPSRKATGSDADLLAGYIGELV